MRVSVCVFDGGEEIVILGRLLITYHYILHNLSIHTYTGTILLVLNWGVCFVGFWSQTSA